MMKERGLGVKDALVAIEYANNRAKAEKELQVITTKVSDMENRAYLLKNKIFASKLQMSKLSYYRPPPPKAALNGSVAMDDQPKTNEPSAENHCSEDYDTSNKD
jgi:hypothetical protein